ncbi:MAG: hypothetical protein QMC90_03970 [Dehalococcoidales bacterium]|nr:hypothetical protein [Dehalococcoidales bacterium]
MATVVKDSRTITQILFSRKREIDIFPQLHGGQEITYPAKRNPNKAGYLSAMLCKSCVVALKGDVIGITKLEPPGVVMVRSLSQSGSDFHHCYMVEDKVWLPRGNVTYHLGLLTLAEGLIFKEEATDLLDALQALLIYRETTTEIDDEYLTLLMHLSDELYYWLKLAGRKPNKRVGAAGLDAGLRAQIVAMRGYTKEKGLVCGFIPPELFYRFQEKLKRSLDQGF